MCIILHFARLGRNILFLTFASPFDNFSVPALWCFLVKQFIPHVLIILFINLAQSDNGVAAPDDGPIFGGYGGYEKKPYQVLGILTFVFALFLFLLGLILPDVYAPLALPQNEMAEEEFNKWIAHDDNEKKATGGSEEEEEADVKPEDAGIEVDEDAEVDA
jgi:hypothetical protein